ncbi:MAG TPA: FAD-binding oxidoreductase [Desulfosporosinus sp.]|nr:FAD-binding oxidoreductase [Desulfosporosinus sp.]
MDVLVASRFSKMYYPSSSEEVRDIVNIGRENDFNIIPMGNGTLVCDYLGEMVKPSIGLCLRKLNRVMEVNPRNLTVTVEAGITLFKLQSVLRNYNLWLPVLSTNESERTIGGMLAENARNYEKYGHKNIGDYVIGLEFITAAGLIIKTGGKTVKNVAGYDFTHLLNGSLGTLAIATKVTLKLNPQPEVRKTFLYNIPDFVYGNNVISTISKMSLAAVSYHMFQLTDSFELNYFSNAKAVAAISIEGSKSVVENHLVKLSTVAGQYRIGQAVINSCEYWDNYSTQYEHIDMKYKLAGSVNKKYLPQIIKLITELVHYPIGVFFDIGIGYFMIYFSKESDLKNAEVKISQVSVKYQMHISTTRLEIHPLYQSIKIKMDNMNCLFSNNTIFSLENCLIKE